MPYRSPFDFKYFRVINDSDSAPARAAFAPVDSEDILAVIAEADGNEASAALQGGVAAASVAAAQTDGAAAYAAAEAGVATFHAGDEDGDWFAVAADSLLMLPWDSLTMADRFAALEAARALAAEDAAADHHEGVYPATDARDQYIYDLVLAGNFEPVTAYVEAYADAANWWGE